MWTIGKEKSWEYLERTFEWVAIMKEVPQDARHHAEGNVAIHTRMVLDALIKEPTYAQLLPQQQEILWAAALLHDVEKATTTITVPDGSITSHGHARKGAMKARQLLYKEIDTPFSIRESVVSLVRYHGLPLWLFEKPDPVKAVVMASLEINMQWLALLARADVLGRVCADQAELLYRIDCFEEFCKEHHCWGVPFHFPSPAARMYYFSQQEGYTGYEPFKTAVAEVIMMSGLPGSGKDSYVRRHYKDKPVVSLDQLRTEMGIAATDKNGNGKVIQAAKEQAREMLRKQTGFVWNATNITRQMRMQLIELFMAYDASVKIIYIEVPYNKLHGQNKSRNEVVPAAVIDKLAGKLEVPALWEAHEVEYYA
ncbi:HDIG domain-containing protein [Filimonas lacunae]|uniref:HDIG domain-containing protein n=2 Tax=Filimonas lacunae TaxID=477680 RepID=A0A173MRH0_9BACT|nr:hypothetical protein FLA_5991 [Filimonas lacunae]SIS81394.1 HDIG domain-containing protein [Filimonas lacunae]